VCVESPDLCKYVSHVQPSWSTMCTPQHVQYCRHKRLAGPTWPIYTKCRDMVAWICTYNCWNVVHLVPPWSRWFPGWHITLVPFPCHTDLNQNLDELLEDLKNYRFCNFYHKGLKSKRCFGIFFWKNLRPMSYNIFYNFFYHKFKPMLRFCYKLLENSHKPQAFKKKHTKWCCGMKG
jgi:hypothetical protein